MGTSCELISWNRSHELCRRLAERIRASGFEPDTIVAIGRGGWIPGRILADLLDLLDLTSFKIEHYHGPRKQARAVVKYPLSADVGGRRVLLVDDVSDSGDTFEVALEHLYSRGTPAAVRTAVIHHKISSQFIPDFHAHKIVKWRWLTYPWALLEDLRTFAAELTPAPRDAGEMARRLEAEHGIRLSAKMQRYLYELLAASSTQSKPSNG